MHRSSLRPGTMPSLRVFHFSHWSKQRCLDLNGKLYRTVVGSELSRPGSSEVSNDSVRHRASRKKKQKVPPIPRPTILSKILTFAKAPTTSRPSSHYNDRRQDRQDTVFAKQEINEKVTSGQIQSLDHTYWYPIEGETVPEPAQLLHSKRTSESTEKRWIEWRHCCFR